MESRKVTYDLYLLRCRCGFEGYVNVIRGYPTGISDKERMCPNCGSLAKAVPAKKPKWNIYPRGENNGI